MKNFLFIAVFIFFSLSAYTQTIPVPEDYKFKDAADYEKYKTNVVECLHWFIDHKVSEDIDQRRQVYAFLLKWCNGSSLVKVSIDDHIAKPIFDDNNFKYNPDILMAYMGGMVLYLMDNTGPRNESVVQMEGLKTVLHLYENNKEDLAASKAIKEYLKINDSGNLEHWVKAKLNSK